MTEKQTGKQFVKPVNWILKRKWWGLILIAVLMAQSCLSIKTWFFWADTYLAREIDRLFEMTSEQEDFIDRHLDEILLLYRQVEFPKYILFLRETKERVERPVKESDIKWFRSSLGQFYDNIGAILADDAAAFLSSLDDAQITHLENELVTENESWAKDSGINDEEERREKRFESIENWLGDLTTEQKTRIITLYKTSGNLYEFRYKRRLASQQRFLMIIKNRPEKADLKRQLLEWYMNYNENHSVEYREYTAMREKQTQELILILDEIATKDQREFLNRKLDAYIIQLEDLVKE